MRSKRTDLRARRVGQRPAFASVDGVSAALDALIAATAREPADVLAHRGRGTSSMGPSLVESCVAL